MGWPDFILTPISYGGTGSLMVSACSVRRPQGSERDTLQNHIDCIICPSPVKYCISVLHLLLFQRIKSATVLEPDILPRFRRYYVAEGSLFARHHHILSMFKKF